MSSRKCVVFVSPKPDLSAPTNGHGARLKHLSQGLSDQWEIIALVPRNTNPERADWVDKHYTYDQWSYPFLTDLNPSFLAAMSRVLRENEVDVVHLSIGICVTKAIATVLQSDATVVYTAQNVEAKHARDFVAETLPLYKRLLGPRLIPYIERATVRCADALTTVSEEDRDTFLTRYDIEDNRITTIPTGTRAVDSDELLSPTKVRKQYGLTADTIAVFHGSYAHPPNREAVTLIEDYIAPATRDRDIDFDILLVGKGMPETTSENVQSVGFVDDLFSVLNAADFAVVPIRHGGGTKTKLYDYISLGLPIVTTTKGAEGMDLVDGVHALITTDVNEAFVDATITAATDAECRERMQSNLQTLAHEYSWDQSTTRLDTFYTTQMESQ